jgi:hypothetical protein
LNTPYLRDLLHAAGARRMLYNGQPGRFLGRITSSESHVNRRPSSRVGSPQTKHSSPSEPSVRTAAPSLADAHRTVDSQPHTPSHRHTRATVVSYCHRVQLAERAYQDDHSTCYANQLEWYGISRSDTITGRRLTPCQALYQCPPINALALI